MTAVVFLSIIVLCNAAACTWTTSFDLSASTGTSAQFPVRPVLSDDLSISVASYGTGGVAGRLTGFSSLGALQWGPVTTASYPNGFARDGAGLLYFARNQGVVTVYDPTDGSPTGTSFSVTAPSPVIAIDGNLNILYVISAYGNHRVARYQLDGTALSDLTSEGSQIGQAQVGLAVLSTGNVLVATAGGRVHEFSPAGVPVQNWAAGSFNQDGLTVLNEKVYLQARGGSANIVTSSGCIIETTGAATPSFSNAQGGTGYPGFGVADNRFLVADANTFHVHTFTCDYAALTAAAQTACSEDISISVPVQAEVLPNCAFPFVVSPPRNVVEPICQYDTWLATGGYSCTGCAVTLDKTWQYCNNATHLKYGARWSYSHPLANGENSTLALGWATFTVVPPRSTNCTCSEILRCSE